MGLFNFNNPLRTSILLYLTTAIALYLIKPQQLFHENGNMIEFGLGINKTCFSYPVAIFISAIIIFFVLVVSGN